MIRHFFTILLLFFLLPAVYAQNNWSLRGKRGVTVITHGFSPGGSLSKEWINFAKAIRRRAGRGSIFVNDLRTGQWKPIDYANSDNPNDEIILLYDWAWASDNLTDGYLEASADHLFANLMNPPVSLNISNPLALLKKPLHLIGHSRGGVLMTQVAHRVAYYFPQNESIKIEQLTLLDPHPAVPMGDCELPGVLGLCPPPSNYSSNFLRLQLPQSVVRADNYYRRDGVYEDFITHHTFGPYDGIKVAGLGVGNKQLNDHTLTIGSSKMGGAHASIGTRWYYGTIDLNNRYAHPIEAVWYHHDPRFPAMGPRDSTGFFHSRLGGGELPPEIPPDKKMAGTKPDNFIFNGGFYSKRKIWKKLIPGWDKNGGGGGGRIVGEKNSTNYFLRLERPKVNLRIRHLNMRTHSYFYIPETIDGEDYCLRFRYRVSKKEAGDNYLRVSLQKSETTEPVQVGDFIAIQKTTQGFEEICFSIPDEYKGSIARLHFSLEGKNNNQVIDIDDIDFITYSALE